MKALYKHHTKTDFPSAETETEAGLTFARGGRIEEAVAAFTRAIELDSSRWEAYRFRGIAHARLAQHQAAVRDFDVALLHNPECAGCLYERGTVKMLSGETGEAVADFSKCVALDPEHAAAYSSRAGVRVRKGLYHEALEDIRAALLLTPQSPDYLHNRAVILAALGRYAEAIADYKRVIEINPKSAGSYNNLAWLLAMAEDPAYRDCKKAIVYAGKALEIGKTGAWMDTLAAAHAECGEFEKAVSIETEAYKLSRPPNENFTKRIEIYKTGRTYAEWRETERLKSIKTT